MADPPPPVLLQVCANDHPPFGEICRFHEAAARALSWRPVTVMLDARAPVAEPTFHYVRGRITPLLRRLLDGRTPVLTLCHRYRAYRTLASSGLARAPLVTVAHEFGLLRRHQRRLRCRLDRLLGRPAVRFAGVSDAVTAELRRFDADAALLPNGLDLARADARRLEAAAARRELGLSDAEFNIGVVGRLHPKKDPGLAVDALRLALSQRGCLEPAGLRLVFVGSGQLEPELRARAAGLPVLFKGLVPDAPRLMAAFDLLLVPSGAREAFGMVALEAMAAGVPVLCGPSPGPSFVTGEAGLRFATHTPQAVADALLEARRSADSGALVMRARLGRVRVEHEFSVAAAARRLAMLVSGDTGSVVPAAVS